MNAIERLLDIPHRNAQREFLIDTVTGQTLTFGELHEAALRVGADLKRRGLQRGDRIAFFLHNSAEFVKLYFGSLYAGLVSVPVNPTLGPDEVEFIIKQSEAKLLIASPETVSQLNPQLLNDSGLPVLALMDNRRASKFSEGMETWDLRELPSSTGFVPFDGVSPDDTMAIVYTSGTTARPSGVAHRISDMVDNARYFNNLLGIGPENRFYGILAMTYLGGYYNLLLLPYVGESSVVLAHTFDARSALDFWKPVYHHGVNTLWLVPTIISILMALDRGHGGERYCREHVKLALVGTAPLPIQLRHDFEDRYGISLYENYGLTETFFIATNSPDWPVKDGSVGHPLPGVQVVIKDDAGNILLYGEEGDIYVRTPYLMQAYYDSEQAQPSEYSRDNLFCTGDVGIFTPTQGLSITGRKKDLIIRGGINISPASIENVLFRHPAVAECAVVGVPHAYYGEDVAAVIRLASGYRLDSVRGELHQLCKAHLSVVRRPAHIVETKEFPHSSSGKIQKDKVRELLQQSLTLGHPQA